MSGHWLGVDVTCDAGDLDLVSIHRHVVQRPRLGPQRGRHRRVLRRVGQLLRAGSRAGFLDLHGDRAGEGLALRGPAQRGVQPEREDHRGGPERDGRERHRGTCGPGDRRREPEADRAGQPQPGGEPVRGVPAARRRGAAGRDRLRGGRRRLERDLHDGTQQRLVSLAMQLGRGLGQPLDAVQAHQVIAGPTSDRAAAGHQPELRNAGPRPAPGRTRGSAAWMRRCPASLRDHQDSGPSAVTQPARLR